MKAADFPKGPVRVYLALGAGIFYSVEKESCTPPPWGALVTAGHPDASIDVYVDLRVGLSRSFNGNLAAFCE